MSRPVDKQFGVSFGYGLSYPDNLKHLTLDGKHHGIDYATPIGTPVYLPIDAVLVESGSKSSPPISYYGNYAIFKFWKQEGLFKSTYRIIMMHMSHILLDRVKVGDWLKENAVIGLTGDSGSASGHPHMHFETQKLTGTTWVHCDPLKVVNA